ncbi:MAG: STAS domain-containing protein [Lentisphaeria bacterium]|nr:STAS domain-containing protein [Lentisphaeria bacterium]
MNIAFQDQGGVTVARLAGRLDSATSPEAERRLSAELDRGAGFLLDLGEVEYVSSAGLRVFLVLAKKSRISGTALALCSLRQEVAEVFDISGFTTLFTLFPDRDAGVGALSGS